MQIRLSLDTLVSSGTMPCAIVRSKVRDDHAFTIARGAQPDGGELA